MFPVVLVCSDSEVGARYEEDTLGRSSANPVVAAITQSEKHIIQAKQP